MNEHSAHCHVDVEPDLLWRYLADYDNVMRLAVRSGRAKLIDGQYGQAGASYEVTYEWEGLGSTATMRLREADEPRRLVWEWVTDGDGSSIFEFDIGADARGSDFRVHLSLTLGRTLKTLQPFAWVHLMRMNERCMRKLRDLTHEDVLESLGHHE